MHELQLSCYICQHVRRALVSARLIVNLGSGHWAAACSTQCLDQSDSDDLFTIRLAYLSHLRGLPLPLQSLPVGSALRRNEIGWSLSYFDMEFRPSEDETHAVPPDHPVRGYDAREIVQAFRSGPHRFATATLQGGALCIPIWTRDGAESAFRDTLTGPETLVSVTLGEVMDTAADNGIALVAVDYLSSPGGAMTLMVRRGYSPDGSSSTSSP